MKIISVTTTISLILNIYFSATYVLIIDYILKQFLKLVIELFFFSYRVFDFCTQNYRDFYVFCLATMSHQGPLFSVLEL